jgi:hypothetical protein
LLLASYLLNQKIDILTSNEGLEELKVGFNDLLEVSLRLNNL